MKSFQKGYNDQRSGFTIVELLIVIVVISILAAITIVAYNGVSQRSKVSRVNTESRTLAQLIKIAVITQNKPLTQITGSGWTLGYCFYNSTQPYRPMNQLPQDDRCWTDYRAAVTAIATAAGTPEAASSYFKGDPWGSPYLIDENEASDSDPCAKDLLYSAGSRGIPFQDTQISYPLGYTYVSGRDISGNACP